MEVLLCYPDFNKPSHLYTDASGVVYFSTIQTSTSCFSFTFTLMH
jgi:hypothetical protein